MLVLDTNVLSEIMRPSPEPRVLQWLDKQQKSQIWLTSITCAEILAGIARLPDGKRKSGLQQAAQHMLVEEFSSRILAFDQLAAIHYAEVLTQRSRAGKPISMADAQIAAMCKSAALTITGTQSVCLATRNEKDFDNLNLSLLNPWLL